MRKLAILILLAGMTLPAFASKRVTVAQLEQALNAARGRPDAEVAQQISDLELTERLSTEKLSQLRAGLPGDKAYQNLLILVDESAFLDPPASEIPVMAAPNFAEQRRIMGLAVSYIGRTIPQLPNFFATRETKHFEDTPLLQRSTDSIAYQPLHFVRSSSETVLYRDGRETVDAGPVKKAAATAEPGLTTWGIFGPVLGVVLVDAAKSKLVWSHWEKKSGGLEAVFSYEVPREKSHYEVNYCCTPESQAEWNKLIPFRQLSGYHGEITINPEDGTILRLSVEANLTSTDPITRADLVVEYGSVNIGGKSYFCPARSLSMSIAQEVRYSNDVEHQALQFVTRPLKTMLNEVVFEQYHMFRADVRVVPENEADANPSFNATQGTDSPASAIASQPSPTEPVPDKASSATSPISPAPPEVPSAAPVTTPVVPIPAKEDTASVPAPILRTTTRAVVVDVVVTKSNGEPVLGLTKQDFLVMEDGKPQDINFFEKRTNGSQAPSTPPAMPPMPAGAHTNVPPAPESDAVNVLLLDTLNTEPPDQAYVHREVMDFLTHMQPGTRVAIFILGSQLRYIQGFTTDTSALIAALNDKRNGLQVQKNHAARSRSNEADDAGVVAELQVMQASPFAIAALQAAQADSRAFDYAARASMTFKALDYLGHYLAGIPGRKNLIWFASSFPVTIFPTVGQQQTTRQNAAVPGYVEKAKTTADIFTVSRIAVYPIDAEGMMTEHVAVADVSGIGAGGIAGHAGSQNGATSPYMAGAAERADTINAMEQLASSTGGKAFFNTNDLNAAMRHAIDDGANYYTLGYSPTEKMDGNYRQIEVKLAKGKYKLAYRQGYNAEDTPVSQGNLGIDQLAPLLQSGMPGATGVLYGVLLGPSAIQPGPDAKRAGQNEKLSAPYTRFDVDLIIRAQDVRLLSDAQGDRSGRILVGLRAYDLNGNAVNWVGDAENLMIRPDQYSAIQRDGLPAHLEIDLPSNTDLHLVTTIFDTNSGNAGTLEIPVSAATQPTKTPSTSKTN
ncbi:VWA domain-containing protein [Telmatobacter sp. DSM 110680]|uniref:VWA domain-containing protein n=1 Tax=Telmatobacter sp. DSM 110680 TaxID=3036704 RepID=A0AAU7DKN2_9BACT